MISENQRLERLAERLRAVEGAEPSPAAKIRAWNLVLAGLQAPATGRLRPRSALRLAFAGLAAAALLLVGAAVAAADSLPDSALYPVKGTIENVEGVFALTAADQLNHHLTLATTRLREAEAMFARHKVELADRALTGMEEQLTSAAIVVKTVRASDPSASGTLQVELKKAVSSHDNQLASLQGQVTNPAAISAITKARTRAKGALQVAGAPGGEGSATTTASPSPSDGQSPSGSAVQSVTPGQP